jgi:histidyl-tRNA synthetase
LIEQLGGKENYAIGVALGMERLLALVELLEDVPVARTVDVYMIRVGAQAEKQGLIFAEQIRDKLPKLKLQLNCGGGSFKSQFKKADKSDAVFAIIIGDDEVKRGEVAIKNLRVEQEQQSLSYTDAISFLKNTIQ